MAEQALADVLFAHWPVIPEALPITLPAGLTLDTWEGHAFLGIVAFKLVGVRARWLGRVPGGGGVQVNVRTYVTDGRCAGVWFLRLLTPSRLMALAGRVGFGLPFARARTRADHHGKAVFYELHLPGLPGPLLSARVARGGVPRAAAVGSLDHWLVERYAVFRSGPRGLVKATIDHAPWALESAAGDVRAEALLAALGLPDPGGAPDLRYADECQLRVNLPARPRPDSRARWASLLL